jgi:hypothetical protein
VVIIGGGGVALTSNTISIREIQTQPAIKSTKGTYVQINIGKLSQHGI